MKTPDEIKKGLECCDFEHWQGRKCEECPYMNADDEWCDSMDEIRSDVSAYIQQLERERDAAVNAIIQHSSCIDCKHSTIIPDGDSIWIDCPKRDGRCRGHNLWEWRGVKEEDTHDNA